MPQLLKQSYRGKLFSTFLTILFLSTNTFSQSSYNYGTTVLVHGYQLDGTFPEAFKTYAYFIKDRIGGNATIYIAQGYRDSDVEFYGDMYWKRVFGNGSGEQIYVFDWADASNNNTTGDLEAAADRLFGMLIKPHVYDDNHQLITVVQPLNRPTHFIAHSRGAILSLQVFHRLLAYFPNKIQIEHFTALDPHPAAELGDVISTQNLVTGNLPGIEGHAEDCAILCAEGKTINIKVPVNVTYAESIYRQDGNYEQDINFDGVPIDNNNLILDDSILGTNWNNSDAPHSRVHQWYFGTVDKTWNNDDGKSINWYNGQYGPRAEKGWYKSRLGGHLTLLERPKESNTSKYLDDAIRKRQGGKPLALIFNGSLYHQSVNWGYRENENETWGNVSTGTSNDNVSIFLQKGIVGYMSYFYIPESNKKVLIFKVSKTLIGQFSDIKLKVQWYSPGNTKVGEEIIPELFPDRGPIKDYQDYTVSIPEELTDKLARFEIINTTSTANGALFFMDDFDLIPSKKKDPPKIPVPNPSQEKKSTPSVVTSLDPNDKLGPVGVHSQRYITGDQAIGYQIRFENFASASAAAQYVKVVDTLDARLLDFSTFQFGYFNIADTSFYAPPGKKNYLRDWDLRPAKNLILRMEADFNDSTGILKATYTALDPSTMELTEDPILGFLPPNTNAPQGEGSLFFTVSAYPTLPHGTELTNTAYIYFDYNPVIPTPPWTNTLDKLVPKSQVQALPDISRDATFTLSWSGTDEGAGTRLYDIYVAVNNSPYKLFVSNSTVTSINFKGKADSTYRFYSIAIDSVGNEEPIPITFDAQTTIKLVGVIQSITSGDWNNPATWDCTCLPSPTSSVIIKDQHTVTIAIDLVNANCKQLTIESRGHLTLNGKLQYGNE